MPSKKFQNAQPSLTLGIPPCSTPITMTLKFCNHSKPLRAIISKVLSNFYTPLILNGNSHKFALLLHKFALLPPTPISSEFKDTACGTHGYGIFLELPIKVISI